MLLGRLQTHRSSSSIFALSWHNWPMYYGIIDDRSEQDQKTNAWRQKFWAVVCKILSPDFTSISRFEQSNSPFGSLTTRWPAARCLNFQTRTLNSLSSLLTQMSNDVTGDRVWDYRERWVYQSTDEKMRAVGCIRHDSGRSALLCIKYKYNFNLHWLWWVRPQPGSMYSWQMISDSLKWAVSTCGVACWWKCECECESEVRVRVRGVCPSWCLIHGWKLMEWVISCFSWLEK
jgi:hypothetical protein